jgi:hypothetical protein
MKKLIFAMLFLMLFVVSMIAIGCDAPRTMKTIYVSTDPVACKSLTIDCSPYRQGNDQSEPFVNENGCGCSGLTGN